MTLPMSSRCGAYNHSVVQTNRQQPDPLHHQSVLQLINKGPASPHSNQRASCAGVPHP